MLDLQSRVKLLSATAFLQMQGSKTVLGPDVHKSTRANSPKLSAKVLLKHLCFKIQTLIEDLSVLLTYFHPRVVLQFSQ